MHRELRRSTMKRHPATTLWLASVVLLAVMATSGDAQDFPSCPRNCSCAREDRDEFEVTCPSDGERIALKLQPRSKAIFLCQVNTVSDDFTLLKDVSVDAGTAMEFRLCPLPDVAFTDILRLRNAAKIQTFIYSSYRKFNDTLERRLFRGLTGVTSLALANNGLTTLPADLLMDMPHLQQISFLNNLVQLPADLFQPVLSLKTIELGKNELSVIPTDLFRNLKKLDLLNIWKNKLSNLSPEMFRDLTSLTSLDLRHNGLTSLPADVFKYLTSLKNLRLDGNEFQTLPTGLFRTNKGLETVHLSDSRKPNLKLPSGLFANLPNLTSVDFNNAGLRELPNDLFWGSNKITSISMKNNLLKEIPTELFQNGTELEKINLSFNHLNSLQEYVFQSCRKLKSLDVSYNKMTNLSRNALSGLDALEELYLENNMLSYIDKDTFRSNSKLKILNMANNKLSFDYLIAASKSLFEDVSPLYKCEGLEKIDLSNNSISYIFSDWKNFFPNLNMINMSHNALESISFYSDAFSPHRNREIDVSHNKISIFDLGEQSETWARENAQVANSDKRQTWLLHGNPFSCNCSNYPFFRYLEKQLAPELQQLVNIVPGNLACAEPDSWQSTPVVEVKSKAITCPLALSAASICPRPCSCALRVADTALIIDCIGKNLTEAPAALPMSPSSNHTELYLTHNKLQKLPDFTLPGYEMVSRLALGSNNITRIHNVTNLPKILQVIELHSNNLTVIEEETMDAFSHLPNLTTITLHDNPWKCDCHLQPLISFVQVNFRKIINPDKMKCLNGQLLSAQTVSGLCSQTSSVVWASLVVALLLGALIGASFAVYYKYAREIKAWLFAHNMCLWFVTEEELDKDKLYDAFVSYSHKDEDFILNELVPNLEGGPIPFKLCLHYRDWVAGEWIPNQITRSVEDSRRTLVVLSPNFLESVWGRMEFRAAHCQALNEGRARVIVVLLGDIGPMDDLDPELRAYLNMNTYVKWGDPWFWKKLRYALPHPPKAMKGSMGLVNRNPKLANGKSTEDKLELICEPNALPPVTTPPAEGNITDPLCIKNALNEALSSPRKVIIPTNATNGTVAGTAAVG